MVINSANPVVELISLNEGDEFYLLSDWEFDLFEPDFFEPYQVTRKKEGGLTIECFSSDQGGYKQFGRYTKVVKVC